MSDRLSPLDAAFLGVEDADQHASLAIASVAVVAGPPPSQEEFVATIGARLRAIRRARQKVRRVPLDLDLPLWVDDPDFDIGYHIRRTALPAPGDDAALHRLVARIMSQRLDRDRPLWECWVIEGLAGGRWAVLSKVHHCMVDGVGGTQLYGAVLGGPEMSTDHIPRPEAAPSTARLLLDAVVSLATNPAEQMRLLGGVLRAPIRVTRQVTAAIGALAVLTRVAAPVTASSLSGPIGRARRFGVVRASLPDVVKVGKVFGVTVNDVVLAAISVGFRTVLLKRGEYPAPDTVRTMVFAPLSWGIRLAARLPQRNIVTVTTNVPGPRVPLTVLGRRIVEILPYVPIALRLRTGVAVLTYHDQLTIGITGDYDGAPDIDLLAAAIQHGLADLVAASR